MNLKIQCNLCIFNNMAERVGFEPTLEFPLNTLSKRAPSATRPSLRRIRDDNGCGSRFGLENPPVAAMILSELVILGELRKSFRENFAEE
jgi:hypothetical protein